MSFTQQSISQQYAVPPLQHDFCEKDYYLFRLYKMVVTTATTSLFLVFEWITRPHGMKDCITKIKELSSQRKKYYQFNYTMMNMIEGSSPQQYDVTLLTACIRFACDIYSSSGTIYSFVKAVKDFRNDIMHEGLDRSENFRPKVNELENCLITLLQEATNLGIASEEIADSVQQVKESVNALSTAQISELDMEKYRTDFLLERLKTVGLANLKAFYKQLIYISPLHCLTEDQGIHLHVSMIYVQLKMMMSGMDNSTQELRYTDIFKDLDGDVGSPAMNDSKIILVRGPAGVGKTTLTRLLIDGWVTGESPITGLTEFDFVIYMECRMPNINEFSELLAYLMPDVSIGFRKDEILRCLLGKAKVLVIVDGLDEMNSSTKKLFQDILNQTQISQFTVFATTRDEAVELFNIMAPCSTAKTSIEVIGIPDNKREEFAIKYHDEMKKAGMKVDDTKGLVEYLHRMGIRLTEYWRIPLHLAKLVMLWVLWPQAVNSITTLTELFNKTEILVDKKLVERLIKNRKCDLDPEEIMDKLTECFRPELYKLALYGQKEEGLILSKESLKKLKLVCKKESLPSPDILGAFFVQKAMRGILGTTTSYSYTHRGMQDFYSALYIVKELEEKNNMGIMEILKDVYKTDLENFNLNKFQEVLKHLISLLYKEGEHCDRETSEEIVKLLEESGVKDEKAWLDILSEVRANEIIIQLAAKYVPDVMKLKNHIVIDDARVAVYAKLLMQSYPKKVTVKMRYNPTEIPASKDLFSALLSVRCDTEVYLYDNFLEPNKYTNCTDHPVLPFIKRMNTLRRFMGYASKEVFVNLPDSIPILYVGMENKEQLEDVLSSVSTHQQLEWLCIHVAEGLNHDEYPALSSMNHMVYSSMSENEPVTLTFRKAANVPLNTSYLMEIVNILDEKRASKIMVYLDNIASIMYDLMIFTVWTTCFHLDSSVMQALHIKNEKITVNLYLEYDGTGSCKDKKCLDTEGLVESIEEDPIQGLVSRIYGGQVNLLCIFVKTGVDPLTIKPYNGSVTPSLVLANLQDDTVEWASQVIQALRPSYTKYQYRSIILPGVKLSLNGYTRLLTAIQIKLKWHLVAPRSWLSCIDSAQLKHHTRTSLHCDVILVDDDTIWESVQAVTW